MVSSLGLCHHPPPIMDYLTVFATCSLVLFPSGTAQTTSQPSRRRLVSPPPITLNLYALLRDDTHCAWFLAKHVLDAQPSKEEPTRELQDEAEVMAWEQIVRAKAFGQALGDMFGSKDRLTVSEEELADLAATHSLGIAEAQPPLPLHAHHHRTAPSLAFSEKHLHESTHDDATSAILA